MKIQFRIRGLNANANLRGGLEKQLERLHNLIPVSTAEVMLEQQRDSAPAFRAHVHLAVPGPDIHAAARDHTLEAVWPKVAKKLRQQIERRKTKQATRAKTNRQHPLMSSRTKETVAPACAASKPHRVRFEFTFPDAGSVCLVGTFNGWHPGVSPMIALGQGRWAKELMLPPGTYQYAVVVDGRWMADPLAQESVPGLLSLFSILRVPVPDTPSDAESAEGDSMQGGIMHPRHNGHAPRKKQRR